MLRIMIQGDGHASFDENADKVLAELMKYAEGLPPAVVVTSALVLLAMTVRRVDAAIPLKETTRRGS